MNNVRNETYYLLRTSGDSDYVSIAVSGMSRHLARENGLIRLERYGPWVPPMSLPFPDVIVTTAFLKTLAKSDFKGWRARPVVKHLIVRSDFDVDDVAEWNNNLGDPEDAILDGVHDPIAADEMGELYELVLEVGCVVGTCEFSKPDYLSYEVGYSSLLGGDLFAAQLPGGKWPICSGRFKSWIEGQADVARWVTFMPFRLHPAESGAS